MKTLRLAATTVAVALMVGGVGVAAANATTAYPPEGGTRVYGVRSGGIYGSAGQVYSEYNVSRLHYSTACSSATSCKQSDWTSSNAWSYASKKASESTNTAFYNVG